MGCDFATIVPFGTLAIGSDFDDLPRTCRHGSERTACYRPAVRLAIAVLVTLASTAHADPDDLVARPIVLAEGQVEANLTVEVDLAPGQIAKPLSLAPDVWFGATDRLTVGIVHSDPAIDRIAPGASLCVGTGVPGCGHIYSGGGIDTLWSLVAGELAVAARVRLLVAEDSITSVWKPAMTFGALARWTRGRWAVWSDPYLRVPSANADAGNRIALWLPITVSAQPTCRWAIDLRTGWNSDLAVWRDGWHIPAWLGARARASDHVDVGAAFGFYSALRPQNNASQRAAFVMVGWRS